MSSIHVEIEKLVKSGIFAGRKFYEERVFQSWNEACNYATIISSDKRYHYAVTKLRNLTNGDEKAFNL